MKYKLVAKDLETTIVASTSDDEKIDVGQVIFLLNLLQESLDLREKQVVELLQENEELRNAIEAFAGEVAFRRLYGYCTDQAFERVSNNQICRTAITHAKTNGGKA